MNLRKIDAVFFRTAAGREPVREWLINLPREERLAIGQDLMRVQWRWPIGMPLCRNMGDGLWEIRTSLPSHRIARLMIYFGGNKLVVLHGFIKKSQKTPALDLELARARKKESMVND